MKKFKCRNCGAWVEAGDTICASCGTEYAWERDGRGVTEVSPEKARTLYARLCVPSKDILRSMQEGDAMEIITRELTGKIMENLRPMLKIETEEFGSLGKVYRASVRVLKPEFRFEEVDHG